MSLFLFLFSSIFGVAEDCPGRDLTALRMSSVFFQGERVRPFLLNTEGGEFVPCSGQEPLIPASGIIAGVRTPDGRVHQVDYDQLLADHYRQQGDLEVYTSLPDAPFSLREICDEDNSDFEQQLAELARLEEQLVPDDPERNAVLELIYEFNSNFETCDAINGSSDRRAALGDAWQGFCRQQQNSSRCLKAMEVDLLTRTIAFEAHPLGEMDQLEIEDPTTVRSMNFPVSRCERRFIGITLRNRGQGRGVNHLGSPYLVDGMDPDIYQIWEDEFTRNSFIAACFSHDALLPEGASDYELERYHLFQHSFLTSLTDTYNILHHPEQVDATMEYVNVRTGEAENVDRHIRHYYHPMAMDKCFFNEARESGWEIRRNSTGVVACRDLPAGRDCALFKNEPHRYNASTGEVQFVHRSNESGNFSHAWRDEDPPWILLRSMYDREPRTYFPNRRVISGAFQASDVIDRGPDLEPRSCEVFGGDSPIGNLSPHWAWSNGNPSYYQVHCNLEDGSRASIGGLNTPQIIPALTN